MSIDPAGRVTVLATEAEGVPFGFIDNLDVASDGAVYFSDASSKFHAPDYRLDLLEARPHGRLLRYDPVTRETRVLLPKLYFANGVALSRNEDFLVVGETYRYRLTRYWLKGEKAGTSDILLDNLPGFPDNVGRKPEGQLLGCDVHGPERGGGRPPPAPLGQVDARAAAPGGVAAPRALRARPGGGRGGPHPPQLPRPGRPPRPPDHRRPGALGQLYLGNLDQDWIGRLALPPR